MNQSATFSFLNRIQCVFFFVVVLFQFTEIIDEYFHWHLIWIYKWIDSFNWIFSFNIVNTLSIKNCDLFAIEFVYISHIMSKCIIHNWLKLKHMFLLFYVSLLLVYLIHFFFSQWNLPFSEHFCGLLNANKMTNSN